MKLQKQKVTDILFFGEEYAHNLTAYSGQYLLLDSRRPHLRLDTPLFLELDSGNYLKVFASSVKITQALPCGDTVFGHALPRDMGHSVFRAIIGASITAVEVSRAEDFSVIRFDNDSVLESVSYCCGEFNDIFFWR